jgi:hypothetical protein
MPFREIVINRDLMTCVEKFFRANGTDVACAASDEYVHADSLEKFRARESSKKKKPPGVIKRHGGFCAKVDYDCGP